MSRRALHDNHLMVLALLFTRPRTVRMLVNAVSATYPGQALDRLKVHNALNKLSIDGLVRNDGEFPATWSATDSAFEALNARQDDLKRLATGRKEPCDATAGKPRSSSAAR